MSNATSPAAPDHAAEITRADNAIRLLIASFAAREVFVSTLI